MEPLPEIPSPGASAPAPENYRANRAGTARGLRVFLLFLVALLTLYLGFVGRFLASPDPGVRTNLTGYLVFSLAAAVVATGAYSVTLLRAPRGMWESDLEIVVEERSGRRRSFPAGRALDVQVVRRYPAGLLNAEGTELVRLSVPEGTGRFYLVETNFFRARTRSP